MTPTSPPTRPVSPADRPPPRDPKAAGGPRDPDAPGFAAALNDHAAPTHEPPSGAAAKAEGASGDASRPDEEADRKGDKGEGSAETAASLVPTPVFSTTHLPLPGQTPPPDTSAPNTAAKGEAQDGKDVKPASSATPRKPALDLPAAETKPGDKAARAKNDAHDFALPINDGKAGAENLPALPVHANAPQRPAEITPPAPPLTSSVPTPQTPIVALPATIALRALDGASRFDIRLDPDDLGRVDVALEIDGNGNIRASIAAEKPEALQLIVREARALEQAFDQAGFQRDSNALSFSLSDRQTSSQSQQDQAARPQITRFFVDGETEPLPPLVAALLNPADGRLDVRI